MLPSFDTLESANRGPVRAALNVMNLYSGLEGC